MLHLFWLPFKLVGLFVSLIFGLIELPFRLLFGVMHLVFGLAAFIIQLGLWAACLALCLIIGQRRGLNPFLCLVLGFLGPIGLLIVLALAVSRPARAY